MKITNKMNLPQAFVEMAQSDYTPTPKQYSATALLKSIREVILERRHGNEIEQDVSDMVCIRETITEYFASRGGCGMKAQSVWEFERAAD